MTALQERASLMIQGLSDADVTFVIRIINSLLTQETTETEANSYEAFARLSRERKIIKGYFPDDFDPDKELEGARMERYGSAD